MNIGLIIQKTIKRSTGRLADRFLKPLKPKESAAIPPPAAPPPAPIPPVTTQAKSSPPPPTPTTPPAAQGELPPPQGESTPKQVVSLFARLARGPIGKSVGTGFKKITGWGTTKLRLKTKRTTAKLFDRLFLRPKPTPLEPSPVPPPPTKVEPKKSFGQIIWEVFLQKSPQEPKPEPVSLPPLMIPPEPIQEPFLSQRPSQNPIVSFFTSLGKNAIGKAVKTGVKKITTWAATKLSLAAIPEPLVSKILLVASLIKDGISLIKRGIKKLINKPQLALVAGLGLIALPILVPMIPAVGIVLTGLGIASTITGLIGGTAKLIGGVTSQAAGFLSGAAGTIGGLFSGLTAISLPAAIPSVGVSGSLGIVILITIIVVMAVGGAFQKGQGGQVSNLGSPVVARAPSSTSHLAEAVIWKLNQCGITAINKGTWVKTETCLRASSLPNKETIIAQFHFSVYKVVGSSLQCVGFVRGVMAALGKDPGGGKDAKDYLDPPPPAGYQPINTNMEKVQKGDLVIIRGAKDGHIAIVVEKTANSIWVAQAWGTSGGAIQITEVNPIYFDGFLRPL